jgi:hypothetical protein
MDTPPPPAPDDPDVLRAALIRAVEQLIPEELAALWRLLSWWKRVAEDAGS